MATLCEAPCSSIDLGRGPYYFIFRNLIIRLEDGFADKIIFFSCILSFIMYYLLKLGQIT